MNRLRQFGGKVGLKINIDKTKVLRCNPGRLDPLTIREREVEEVAGEFYISRFCISQLVITVLG